MTELPYYPDVAGAPQNSIIGGASLWVMGGKKPEEYKGIAQFFTYLSGPAVQEAWHEATGYLPITKAAYEATKASGFYDKNPGTEVAIIQMTAKPPTENSRGPAASATWCRSATSSPRIWKRVFRQDGRAKPRSTTRSPAATRCSTVPEEHAITSCAVGPSPAFVLRASAPSPAV